MGALMRRYWHPVAAAAELEQGPVKAVKLLGESLVLYRDKRGQLGLLGEACAHRRVSLVYGIPEKNGLRCAYHGWLYDFQGRCLEQPAEALDSTFKDRVAITAYPVEELSGLIFAYLGPEPRPLLPRYNVLAWKDAAREINGSVVPCNWLQVMENLFDPLHVQQLHGRFFAYVLERKGGGQLQEFLAHYAPTPMKKVAYDTFDHGIIQRYVYKSEEDYTWKRGEAMFLPATWLLGPSRTRGSAIFIVPIDDTHTWFVLHMAERLDIPVALPASVPFFDVPGADATGKFITDTAHGQDYMAVVTPGDITRRDLEHLGRSDIGITLYRRLLQEQVEVVLDGGQPMNVYRDPAKNQVIELPGTEAGPGI
jgi:5,5'-dehydrodivanillate O-demethylase